MWEEVGLVAVGAAAGMGISEARRRLPRVDLGKVARAAESYAGLLDRVFGKIELETEPRPQATPPVEPPDRELSWQDWCEDEFIEPERELLAVAREESHMTCAAVGEYMGLSKGWIRNIEKKDARIRRGDLRKVAEIYGVEQEELLPEGVLPQRLECLPDPEPGYMWVDGAELRRLRRRAGMNQSSVGDHIKASDGKRRIKEAELQRAPVENAVAIDIARALDLVVEEFAVSWSHLYEKNVIPMDRRLRG